MHESSYSKVMGGDAWLDTLSIAPLSAVTQVLAHPLHCICTAGCAAQRQTQIQYLYIYTHKHNYIALLDYQRSPMSTVVPQPCCIAMHCIYTGSYFPQIIPTIPCKSKSKVYMSGLLLSLLGKKHIACHAKTVVLY